MQNKKQEKTYFDEFTAETLWDAFTDKTYKKITRLFLKHLNPKKDDQIVDMGCGTGQLVKKIKDFSFKKLYGLDISEKCIQKAKQQYKDINFQVKDIENTNLKKCSVDILIYCGVLHHLRDHRNMIKEAYRILKEGGKIFIIEPNANNPVLWLFRNKKSPFRSNKLKTPNEEFLTKPQIKSIFEKQNLKVMKLEGVSVVSYTKGYFKRLFPFPFFYLVYAYNLFDYLLNKSFLRNEYGSFFFGYIKKP